MTGFSLQQLAGRPFRFGPSVLRPVHPEQADEPIEMRLQVLRAHPREAPKAPLRPRARAVRHGRRLDAQGARRTRLERAMPPFERRGVRDAAVRGHAPRGRAGPHEADGAGPGGQVLLAELERGSGKGAAPAAACAALEALEPGRAGPGPPRIRESAAGARRMRAIRGRRPVERPGSAATAAFAPRDGGGERLEAAGRKRRGEPAIRVRLRHGRSSCPPERPPDRIVAERRIRWAPGHVPCWLKPPWQLAEGIIEGAC